ncbi:membrane protein [Enterococcus phage heks]|nr:membrane protein [Enterococcus phage heks]
MSKQINTIMFNLASFREDMKNLPRETVDIHIAAYRALIDMLPLKRDQHAANMMLDAMIKKMIQCDLTLAYEYAGDLFVTYNKPVPGMSTTEELHALNLRQDAWDNMRRVMVWAESGKIYE